MLKPKNKHLLEHIPDDVHEHMREYVLEECPPDLDPDPDLTLDLSLRKEPQQARVAKRAGAKTRRLFHRSGIPNKNAGVLAALLHDLLTRHRFTDLGDVAEALKQRAARLRITYTGAGIHDAMQLVGRTRPLVGSVPRETLRRPVERNVDPPCSRLDAVAILARLGVRC